MIAADHHLRQVVIAGILDGCIDGVVAGEACCLGTHVLGHLQGPQDAVALALGQALQLRGLDVHDVPGHLEMAGDAGGGADDFFGTCAGADASQQRFARLPDRQIDLVAAVLQHLIVDAVGGSPQRQFAQRNQVTLAKEVANRPFRLLRQVDLALLEPLQEFVRRQIDQHHFVGGIEHLVGDGLPDADAGDAGDHVVERLQVLHVDRRVDIDAGREQFLDILPALRVPRAGNVRVRQLIHQNQGRLARQRCIEIEFQQPPVAVMNFLRRQPLETIGHDFGFDATVSLDDADDDVDVLQQLLACRRQHGEGLADAGRGAEEDLQLASRRPRFLRLETGEQFVGIGASLVHVTTSVLV